MTRARGLQVFCSVLLSVIATNAAAALLDNGDGTITDTEASRRWTKEVQGYGEWGAANTWAEDLVLGGAEDWRLPTASELDQLRVHMGGAVGAPLTGVAPFAFGGYGNPYWIWSSTPGSNPVTKAVALNFYDGAHEEWLKGSTMRRLAVRVLDDDDGIAADVDLDATAYSNGFRNGATQGQITDRGDQTLTVTASGSGVRIEAASGGGSDPAVITACGGTVEVELSAGTAVTITCGSSIVRAETANIALTFLANGWPQARLTLPAGNQVTFDGDAMTLTAGGGNSASLSASTEREVLTIAPGETAQIVKCPPSVTWPVIIIVFITLFVFVFVLYWVVRRRTFRQP